MRAITFFLTFVAAACGGFVDHVVAPNRAHEVHHGRGYQNIQYHSPRVQLPAQSVASPHPNPLPRGEGSGAEAGLTIGQGSSHVGDPSELIRASGAVEVAIADARMDASERDAAIRERDACTEILRVGRESVTCTVLGIMGAQERMFRVAARAPGGGFYLPYGGSWGAGQGYYRSDRLLDEVADAAAARQVFAPSSGNGGAGGRPHTLRETVDSHGRRINAQDHAIDEIARGVSGQGGR